MHDKKQVCCEVSDSTIFHLHQLLDLGTLEKFLQRLLTFVTNEGMNVSLTPHYENLLKTCVESGRYNNASEVVREALRVWEKQYYYDDWLRQEAQKGCQDVLAGRTTKVENKEDFMLVKK